MHINPKSLSLELTLLASRRLNTWETLSFFCSSHIRADTIMRSLQRLVPEGLLCIFSFFLVALLLRLSSAACSLDRCQEEMVED